MMQRSWTSVQRRRARIGTSLLELVVVVAVLAAAVTGSIVFVKSSNTSTLGSLHAMTRAFQRARQEARSSQNGATLYLIGGTTTNATATIYDGIAGTTFVNTPVERVEIPALVSVQSGNATATQPIAILFSSDGNLTYANWTIGNGLTPADCHNNLVLQLESAAGGHLGYVNAMCGSQVLNYLDDKFQPITTTPGFI
jgi:type II secretory pathway pseudopilin PulG